MKKTTTAFSFLGPVVGATTTLCVSKPMTQILQRHRDHVPVLKIQDHPQSTCSHDPLIFLLPHPKKELRSLLPTREVKIVASGTTSILELPDTD